MAKNKFKSLEARKAYFNFLKNNDSQLNFTSENVSLFDKTDQTYIDDNEIETQKIDKVKGKSLRRRFEDHLRSFVIWACAILFTAFLGLALSSLYSNVTENIKDNKSNIKELNSTIVNTNQDVLISKANYEQLLKDIQKLESKYTDIDNSITDYNLLILEIQKDLELINYKIDTIN